MKDWPAHSGSLIRVGVLKAPTGNLGKPMCKDGVPLTSILKMCVFISAIFVVVVVVVHHGNTPI